MNYCLVKDKYNLYKRIKSINRNYTLVYSYVRKLYEVHDFSCKFGSLCLSVKPSRLDARILKTLFVTRRENMKKLFQTIELENQIQEEKNKQQLLDKSSDIMTDIIEYSARNRGDLTKNEIHNIIDKMEIK